MHESSMARSTSEVNSIPLQPWDPQQHRRGSMFLDATESEGGPGVNHGVMAGVTGVFRCDMCDQMGGMIDHVAYQAHRHSVQF
jgi:hypothetical protein